MPNLSQQIGQPAPNFALPATTAAQISLADFRGRTVLLVFVRHLG